MRMEANDYVSYELAVKLKEAEFDEPCDYSYYIYAWMSEPRFSVTETAELEAESFDWTDIYSAPTLWQAQKWLREKKHLSVEPYANIVANFNYNIADLESFADYKGQGIGYESYECALASGIFSALELIKKGE